MAAPADLIECPFPREYLRSLCIGMFAIHKPIKLHTLHSHELNRLGKDNLYQLAYSFDLKDGVFQFNKMHDITRIRCIELLASLTLHYFSKTSKDVYYQCLDLRGLECWSDKFGNGNVYHEPGVHMERFEGKYSGRPRDKRFYHFCTYYGQLMAGIQTFFRRPEYFRDTHMRFSTLVFSMETKFFAAHFRGLCAAVMHRGVRNAQLHFNYCHLDESDNLVTDDTLIQLEDLEMFFDVCKNVSRFSYWSLHGRNRAIHNFTFAQLRQMIEKWSLLTTKLEFFYLKHFGHDFQLHNHKLMKCVVIENEWFMTKNYSESLVYANGNGDSAVNYDKFVEYFYIANNYVCVNDVDYHVDQLLAA